MLERALIVSRAAALLTLLLIGFSAQAAPEPLALQKLIDETPDNGTLTLEAGVYAGPVIIDHPMVLDGAGVATINAGGKGSVIVIETDGATVRNLHLTNSGESHNDIDSGVQIRGNYNVVKDNRIDDSLFGVDLQQSENNVVRRNTISSKTKFTLGQRGDAVRLWYSFHNEISDNVITNSRDMVVWYSANNTIRNNQSSDSRYSLHFMYSRFNLVEGNRYHNNTVGIFLMYSDGVVVKDNLIAHAAGPTGVGIGFKETSDLTIENNEILYCASGFYIDVSPFQPDTTNRFSGNLLAYNGIGVRFLNDWRGNEFRSNRFVDNLTQVFVSSGKTANNNLWEGNYWSSYEGFDEDADGTGDSPFELYSYADRLWRDEPYAQFFKGSPMLEVLDFLERLAPFSEPNLLVRDIKPVSSPELLMVSAEATEQPTGTGDTDDASDAAPMNALQMLRQSMQEQ